MRSLRRLAGLTSIAAGVAAFVACAGVATSNRKGLQGNCDSDRDCVYGLVCRGAAVGQPGPRHCVYEQYSSCTKSADCYPGRICRNGSCSVQCLRDVDCLPLNYIRGIDKPDAGQFKEDAYKCVVGECRIGDHESSCFSDDDCSPGQTCVAGQCAEHRQHACSSDADCDADQHCVARVCQ